MEACIEACLNCHRVCLHMALTHCIEIGGKHTEPAHFKLMINCAEMCQTCASFMISGSELHHLTCGVCAEVCRRCAASCQEVGDMDDCVTACQTCVETCSRMAA